MPHQQIACARLFHLHLMQSSRTFSVTFTTSSLSTPAAYGSLKPAPTSRLRRASLHLQYSTVPKHVLDTTPHRSVRARPRIRLLIWDAWRRSELVGKGAELVGTESSVPAAEITAARASDRPGYADSTRLATHYRKRPNSKRIPKWKSRI